MKKEILNHDFEHHLKQNDLKFLAEMFNNYKHTMREFKDVGNSIKKK